MEQTMIYSSNIDTNTFFKLDTFSFGKTLEYGVNKVYTILNIQPNENMAQINWMSIQSIISGLGIALIISIIALLFLYLLYSIGLYKLARNQNEEFAWLAFIPIASTYVIGKVVGKTSIYGITVEKTQWLLPIIKLTMFLPMHCIFSILLFILAFFGILYRLYQKYTKKWAILLVFLSIILPIMIPIIIFSIRNKKVVIEQ